MMTRRDPFVNMLRSTAAVFAAGAGGADHVTVLPFTLAIGLPDPFARRMARNVQTVLARESRIGAVRDAAAGSGYVEALTARARREGLGGVPGDRGAGRSCRGARRAGTVQAMLAETATARAKDVARRKEAITGVSEFPNLAEAPVAVLDAPRRQARARRPAAASARRTVRGAARPRGCPGRKAARRVHGEPRPHRRLHGAGDVHAEPVRGRRHRGAGQRRLRLASRGGGGVRRVRRDGGVRRLLRHGLRDACRGDRDGAEGGGCVGPGVRGQARRARGGADAGRRGALRLRRDGRGGVPRPSFDADRRREPGR